MDRYEVMAGKMTPLTDGAHRKWGFAGKVETRSYERLVELAKNEYLAWLEHKADRYTTVYGYMD